MKFVVGDKVTVNVTNGKLKGETGIITRVPDADVPGDGMYLIDFPETGMFWIHEVRIEFVASELLWDEF